MVDLVDYGEGTQNAMYYLFLATPFIYAGIMLALYLKGSSTLGYKINWYYYLTVLYGLASIWFCGRIKQSDWEDRKKDVHSMAEFYAAQYQNNILGLAIPVSSGTIGMLLFLLTGDLILPGTLLVLSLIGLMRVFPTKEEQTAKKNQIKFTNEQL